MTFTQLLTTRKGTAGERLVSSILRRHGRKPYVPDRDGPHPFDNLVWNPFTNALTIVEVKTYPRFAVTDCTGIDAADFDKYRSVSEQSGLPLYLLFVDRFEGAIYGAFLSDLTPVKRAHGKVFLPLSSMTVLHRLTAHELSTLPELKDPVRYKTVLRYFDAATGTRGRIG